METPNAGQADLAAARLAAIVQWSEDVIISKDLNGVIQTWNQAAERIFGYSASEAIGQHITLIIPTDRRAEEDDVIARIRRGETVDHFETIRQAKDGRLLDISLTVSPIRDARGTIVGASKIARDITERKQLEAQQAALLAREQRALALAEEANRARDQFIAILSHELRNPLNAMTVALHVAEVTGSFESKTRQVITRQVRQLIRLVDDLLDVTRLATGKIDLRSGAVNLGAVAQRVATTTAEGAGVRRVTCHAPADVWIQGDEARLEQILTNLLTNAVKFTPIDGRITLTVTAENDEALVRVEDTGVGISADLLPRIFDLFVQGQTGLHRRNAGLGIGLTLVKQLVDLHGGQIDVASAGPGRGSVFSLRFPRIEPVRRAAAEAAPRTASVHRRILIIEDDTDARQMLRYLLELSGHEVHDAEEGIKGLELGLALRPDVVIIDVGLPGLDGYQVAGRIRATGCTKVLLIALTGYGQMEDRVRSREAGFDAHLTKPVDPTVLNALLESRSPG
jgi:two-component system CheB/CheR fusion protein